MGFAKVSRCVEDSERLTAQSNDAHRTGGNGFQPTYVLSGLDVYSTCDPVTRLTLRIEIKLNTRQEGKCGSRRWARDPSDAWQSNP
jgi:hypothetical protein